MPTPELPKRECRKCGMSLPLHSFHLRKAEKDGRSKVCKGCTGAYMTQRYPKQQRDYFVERTMRAIGPGDY